MKTKSATNLIEDEEKIEDDQNSFDKHKMNLNEILKELNYETEDQNVNESAKDQSINRLENANN